MDTPFPEFAGPSLSSSRGLQFAWDTLYLLDAQYLGIMRRVPCRNTVYEVKWEIPIMRRVACRSRIYEATWRIPG